MSEWKKVEQPLDPLTPEDAVLSVGKEPVSPVLSSKSDQILAEYSEPCIDRAPFPEPEPALSPATSGDKNMIRSAAPAAAAPTKPVVAPVKTPDAPVPVRYRHYTPDRRPGRHRLAAPLGFMVIILALVGIVSLVVSGWGMIKKATDDTPLKEDMAAFLEPVMLQNPAPFTSVKQAASNPSCVKAALWQVTETERIRMRQKKEDTRFQSDDSGRVLLSEKEVAEAFQALFGSDISPDTSLFSQKGDAFSVWYDKDKKQYHVPAFTASLYQPVIGSIKKDGDTFLVKVGYVAQADMAVDEQGNDISPTLEDASLFQQFTVVSSSGKYKLTAVQDLDT